MKVKNMSNTWFLDNKKRIVSPGRPFIKMHGLRNDFVIVDGRDAAFNPSAQQIVNICDRHEGVGGDELLIVNRAKTAGTYAYVRIINPDGREVEACGNASRCVGWLLLKEAGKEEIQIQTLGGILTCSMAGEKRVSVEMGQIKTEWDEIPLSKEMDTLHLGIGAGGLKDPVGMNIGNPHAVFFVDNLETADLPVLGKVLQTHDLFPEEANIGVAQVLDPHTLKLDVWERPGNMTTACGTGACVAVAAARRRGLTDQARMKVIMPAGSVEIEIKDNNLAVMTGPAEICFTGFLDSSLG